MATTEVFIPDGEFCGDRNTLGCKFETHMTGFHYCSLYNESIGKLEDIYVNGEHQRAFRKCDKCKTNMTNDKGNGLVEDDEI
jgi:hypothetical protein